MLKLRNLLFILLLPLLLFILLQVDPVRIQILAWGQHALHKMDINIHMEGLRGHLPIDFSLDRITLADAQGIWLELDELHLAWRPWALLRGRLHIEDLSLREFSLERLPLRTQTESSPPQSVALRLPKYLPVILLDKLTVPSIAIGNEVFGEAVRLGLEGNAIIQPKMGVHAQLNLRRLDQESAQISIAAKLTQDQILDASLIAEESGGLVKRLTKLPLTGPLALHINGRGPISQWPGKLELHLPGMLKLATSLRVAIGETQDLYLEGTLSPDTKLVQSRLSSLLGEMIPFDFGIQLDGPQQRVPSHFSIDTPVARLQARGIINLQTQRLVLDMGVDIADLAKFQPLLAQPIVGSAQLKFHGDGELRQPRLQLTLEGKKIGTNRWHLAELITEARIHFPHTFNQGFPGLKADIHGQINKLKTNIAAPTDKLTFNGKIRIPSLDSVEVPIFELEGGNAKINLSGVLAPKTKEGIFNLNANISDLAPWAQVTHAKLSGGISLNAQGKIAKNSTHLDTQIEIKTRNLSGLPLVATELLGPNVKLMTNAHLNEKRQVRLENLVLNGKEFTLTVDGDIPLNEGQFSLKSQLTLPRIEVLNKKAGIPVAGVIRANLMITGPLREPRAQLELAGQRLKYGNRDLQNLQATLNVNRLTYNQNGNIEVRLGPVSQSMRLSTNFDRHDSKLAIHDLFINAPSTQLRGEANLNLDNLLLQGKLEGRVDDLGSLAYWSGQENLNGTLDMTADFTTSKTQQLILHLNGSAISGNFGHIDEIKTNLSLADAHALSGIALRVETKGIMRDTLNHGARLKSGIFTAKGNSRQLDLSANLNAERPKGTFLNLEAQLQRADKENRILLRNLAGTFHGKPFNAKTQTQFVANTQEVRFDRLALDFAGAHLNADARIGAKEVTAAIDLDSLPLQFFSDSSIADLAGMLSAKLRLDGTKINPKIRLDVNAHDLKALNIKTQKLPSAQLIAQAELAAGKLVTDLRILGLTDQATRFNLAVPMTLTLDPFDFHLDEHASLDGQFVGKVDISHLNQILSLDGQKLAGILNAAVRLSGSPRNPNLDGNIQVARGLYENDFIGTLIKDLNLDLQLAGQSMTITELSANDGAKGRINAKGELVIDPHAGSFRFDTKIDLNQATLVRSDLASATLNGYLALGGDQKGANTTGKLEIIKSAIYIPERVAPDVPTLKIRETPKRRRKGSTPTPTKGSLYPVNLDIKVEIPTRSFVRGRGLDSEWRGSFDIVGTSQEPQITGQLRIQRGIFDFLDRRFKIQEGTIDFYGNYPPKPNINLKAEAEGRDMLAILSLTGSATNPELTLESQPTLPQDEVLARLLFDREIKEISVLQALKLAAAVRTLAGGGGGMDLFSRTRDSLGLDNLSMESDELENKSVKAGKYLSEDVYLEVESGLGTDASKVRVEKEISRQLSIETSVDQNSSSTVGINWKIDY